MRKGVLLLLLCFMLVPVQSRSFTFPENPARKNFFSLFQSHDIRQKVNPEALRLAMRGYYNLKQQGMIQRDGILTLIDFQKPSVEERIFVIDVNSGKLLFSGLVAHGRGSGDNIATEFSNLPGSNKSSVGFYVTDTTYQGKHGYSLRLRGMETGINDNALDRAIVVHGADYVSYDFIRKNGRLGRSQGCPALSFDSYEQVIDMIKGGTCLFIFHSAREYASRSEVLNPRVALRNRDLESPV
jgi:hypothetical protein